MRTFCGLYNRSRASNFRPTVAKAIYERYSGQGSNVLDFSSGFGGRAFAAFAAERIYHAIDPEQAHIDGIRQLHSLVGGHLNVSVACAEEEIAKLPDQEYELIFTSPPYFNLEKYSENPLQSYNRYQSFDQWLLGFLRPVVKESFRVLIRGGFLVVNIANAGKYPIADKFYEAAKEAFGPHETIYDLMIQSNPSYIAKYGQYKRAEPIFVFKR